MYRYSRNANANDLPSFSLPPQLVDPSLRGGSRLFPNLRVGNFSKEALAQDLTPYRVAKMFRPDTINMNASNPRRAKALEDIQFFKAGQSPGQAKSLGELIRKDPALGDSFNVGYGSTLNREQGLAQKEGRAYEFDPTDEMWRSGFKRKNPDIVAMGDLQDALRTMPSGSRLTTYSGQPLDPNFTRLVYNSADPTQGVNDPQLFYNLKGKSDVDYGRIAQALNSIPIDKTKKADYSLAKRWERVQGYSPYPPSGFSYVLNADKPYQTINQVMADVDLVEPRRSARMADDRIARSQNSGNSDNNNIPKDFTRKEYLEATGDSDNLPPTDYTGGQTLVKLSDWEYADRNGYPMDINDVARAMRNPTTTVEDRSFILNQPQLQRPTTRLGTQRTAAFSNPYRQALPQGEIELPNGMVVNQADPIKAPELAKTAWAKESALYPNTSERIKGLDTYYRVAEQDYSLSNRDGSPLSANGDSYTYVKDFKSPEAILPSTLATKYQPYAGNMGHSPNNYRMADSTAARDGYNEFNEALDEGVQVSKDLDRLYQLNDLATPSDAVGDIAARTNDLIRTRKHTDGIKMAQPIGNIFEYIQPDILDEIVMAERKQQDMGGTYRALTGKHEHGVMEALRIADTPAPLPLRISSPEFDEFNQAQYTRDMIDRGGVLIATQLGIPIVKASTSYYDAPLGKNISYAQTVRPSRVASDLPWGDTQGDRANWQAPESMSVGRVGRQAPIQGVPELPTDTGMTAERRAALPMATLGRQLMNDTIVLPTPMQRASLPSRERTDIQGQVLYPATNGLLPLNYMGNLPKPKATIGELFGFSALTPEALDKYKDMTLRY